MSTLLGAQSQEGARPRKAIVHSAARPAALRVMLSGKCENWESTAPSPAAADFKDSARPHAHRGNYTQNGRDREAAAGASSRV